jgi:cytidylate kinase
MDGRDMGTVVVPHAELKVHVTADLDVRARRRQAQLKQKGEIADLQAIKDNLHMRDAIDYDGPNHTSTIHPDARILDTTHLHIDEQIEQVVVRAQHILDTSIS